MHVLLWHAFDAMRTARAWPKYRDAYRQGGTIATKDPCAVQLDSSLAKASVCMS